VGLLKAAFAELGRDGTVELCFLSGVPRQADAGVKSMLLGERATLSKARTFVLADQLSRVSVYMEKMVTAVSSLELRKLSELCVSDVEACGESVVEGITRNSGVAINNAGGEQCSNGIDRG
jgi:hypothetical protein